MGRNVDNERVLAEIYSAAGTYILEGGVQPQLVGDPAQVTAIQQVTQASRRLYEALSDRNSSLDLITQLHAERQAAALNFEKVIGSPWRL